MRISFKTALAAMNKLALPWLPGHVNADTSVRRALHMAGKSTWLMVYLSFAAYLSFHP
jgi:hypothetical protein